MAFVPGMTPTPTPFQLGAPASSGPYNAPAAITDPQQLLQATATLAQQQGYSVEPDGRIYKIVNGQKDYFPPWSVWTGPNATPPSDPGSPWHFMYTASGPFTNTQQWDSSKGTFKGGINWPTLLTAIGVGGMIAAGVAAGGASATTAAAPSSAAGGGGAAAAAPPTTLASLGSTGTGLGAEGVVEGSALPTAGLTATGAGAVEAGAPSTVAAVGATGASTAPVATTAGPAAGSGFANSLWGKLALSAAGRIGQAAIQSYGAGKAADIQTKYGQEALALQQPWLRTGTEAINSLEQRMHLGVAPTSTVTPPGGPVGLPQTGMATLRAPTGEMQQVPSWQAPFYVQRGAQQVG